MIRKLLLERPLLIGGLGVTASLSLITGAYDSLLDGAALVSFAAAGAGLWWWRRHAPETAPPPLRPAMPVSRESVEAALKGLDLPLSELREVLHEVAPDGVEAVLSPLQLQRQSLLQELGRATLQVAIVGTSRTGKTCLLAHLRTHFSPQAAQLALSEVTLAAESSHSDVVATLLGEQDAAVYLITEDLTDSGMTDLKALSAAGLRVLLAFNKQDNYLPDEQKTLLRQIESRLRGLNLPIQVAAIATAPKPIKVRTHSADGQVQERLEPQAATVAPVITALEGWLSQEVAYLVAQTVMRRTEQLRQAIQGALNTARHRQALPIVEQLQWTAAAATFANPLPSLDLLAASAITGQLILDLSRVYQQPLSLDQARTLAAEVAKLVTKLGLVEVSTQLLSTALKSHAATYVVGGSVQALSAAYLTRLAGESLMAYLEERALSGQAGTALTAEAIGEKIQAVLPVTQRTDFLKTLVKQGMQRLAPASAPLAPAREVTLVSTPVEVVPEKIGLDAEGHS